MTAAVISSDSRVWAPASLLSAEADTEPPTGMPWKIPDAMLPTPWPTKSRDASPYVPSAFGKLAEMPAPCTRPTKARESAGRTRAGMSSRGGSWGRGRASIGTPRSARVATVARPSSVTAAEVATTAMTIPSDPSRVRSRPTISPIVAAPIATDGQSSWAGLVTVTRARMTRLAPSALEPGQVRQLAQDDVHARPHS